MALWACIVPDGLRKRAQGDNTRSANRMFCSSSQWRWNPRGICPRTHTRFTRNRNHPTTEENKVESLTPQHTK